MTSPNAGVQISSKESCFAATSEVEILDSDQNKGVQNDMSTLALSYDVATLKLDSQCEETSIPMNALVRNPEVDSMKRHDLFTFTQLDLRQPGEFRLLYLLPCQNPTTDGIRCELMIATLPSHAERYEALSYTWGQATKFQDIQINGFPYPVAENLYWALYYLRLRDPTIVQILWIDALCIDQSSPLERSHQVSQMGEIYRRARSVIVWLGVSADNSDIAIELIANDKARSIFSTNKSANVSEMRESLIKLCSRQYWTRFWIVQEILLARSLVIHVGPQSCDWISFGRMFFPLSEIWSGKTFHTSDWHVWSSKQRALGVTAEGSSASTERNLWYYFSGPPEKQLSGTPAFQLVDQRRLMFQKHPKPSLLTLLHRFGMSQCQEPRDKLYGLLGIGSDPTTKYIAIDYKKPLFELFFELVSVYDARTWNRYEDGLITFCIMLHQIFGQIPAEISAKQKERSEATLFQTYGQYITSIDKFVPVIRYRRCQIGVLSVEARTASNSGDSTPRQQNWLDFELDGNLLSLDECSPHVKQVSSHLSYAIRLHGPQEGFLSSMPEESGEYAEQETAGPNGEPKFFLCSAGYGGIAPPGSRVGDIICKLANVHEVCVLRHQRNGTYKLVGIGFSTFPIRISEPDLLSPNAVLFHLDIHALYDLSVNSHRY